MAVKKPATWRPMDVDEQKLAIAVGRCSFPIASFSKRFAREVRWQAEQVQPQITEKQLAMLFKLARKYRRQIQPEQLDEEHRFLLDPSIPLPDAPSSSLCKASDGRNAPTETGATMPVQSGPGQLSFFAAGAA